MTLFGCSNFEVSNSKEGESRFPTEENYLKNNSLSDYSNNVKSFKKIDTKKFLMKVANSDNFFIYFGRATCPYCRDFVLELKEVAEDNQINIFYLDTENTESNLELQKIREEYNVEYVPTLLYMQNGEKASSFSIGEDLASFLKKATSD